MQITNNQYFLLLPEINLYPEIKINTIEMLEQVMNALILVNKHNIQQGINAVITVETHSKPLINEGYLTVLQKIKPFLDQSKIYIAQGEKVRFMYPKYNKGKYYWDVGKQAAINLEFALEKKLSFDGEKIIWESTYIDWINQIITENHESSTYNSNDELLYYHITPKALDNFIETREIILKETENYVKQFRQQLQNKQANT